MYKITNCHVTELNTHGNVGVKMILTGVFDDLPKFRRVEFWLT